jgi:pilus assembly protein FimV
VTEDRERRDEAGAEDWSGADEGEDEGDGDGDLDPFALSLSGPTDDADALQAEADDASSLPAEGLDEEAEAVDDPTFDAVEIKLDLARAYLAMGDYQAMRILLDEIGEQGTPAQRETVAELRRQAGG